MWADLKELLTNEYSFSSDWTSRLRILKENEHECQMTSLVIHYNFILYGFIYTYIR